MVGQFGLWAKKQSKFLKVECGESILVEWTGNAVLSRGQFGEGWDFDFLTDDGLKTYTLRNSRIVAQFDNYKAGDKLIIRRNLKDEKPSLAIYREGEESPW